jgi:glycopeptide antibiotics resistance protein
MDASQLWCPEILHSGRKHEFFFFYLWWVCEMLWNTSKHHFGSNGLGWMLRNFGTPKYCIRARNTSFSSFTCWGFVKCSETLPNIIFGSDGLEWTLHKFWYPEIVHSGWKYEFCIFYTPKVREMLWNTAKHHFGSNGLECFTTLAPRNSAFRLEHKFCVLYVLKVSEIIRNTQKHHFGSNGLEWMLHNFCTPK